MPTHTLTHLTGTTDHRAAMATLIAGASAGDTVVIPANATDYSFTAPTDPGDGTPYYAIVLKSGSAGNPITYTINGNITASASSYAGTDASIIGIDKKSHITINGSGSVNGAAMPQDGEHRHCINMRGSDNITIDWSSGLTLKNSGGDGLYIGPTGLDLDGEFTTCTTIFVADTVFSGNRRQGCSVISANVLRIRRCQFLRTVGASTYSGLSFEPEENTTGWAAEKQHRARLTDCLVEDCVAYGNTGGDFYVQLSDLSSSHADVDLNFRRCKSSYDATGGDPWGFALIYGLGINFDGSSVAGTVRLHDCDADGLQYPGLHMGWDISSNVLVDVRNFRSRNCGLISSERSASLVLVGAPTGAGVRLSNVIIEEKQNRSPIAVSSSGGAATNVTGNVRMVTPHWPVNTQRNSLLPNLKIGRFGRLQFSNSAKSRRSAQRGER